MSESQYKQIWENYNEQEMQGILPIVKKLGFVLDKEQTHNNGERYLMSGFKLVLLGKHLESGDRVVIKVSSHSQGKKEIINTYRTNNTLNKINFAYRNFFSPEDILFKKHGKYIIYITKYIEQKKHFIDHSLEDQFFISLRAFETQESAHITTYSHIQFIKKTFETVNEKKYIKSFESFMQESLLKDPKNKDLKNTFEKTIKFILDNQNIIKTYSGFLTHHDFVPHNMRIVNRDIYLIDHSSIYFGNKYESWARFVNFMTIHNPKLEKLLSEYVRNNRGEDEYLSLRLMRAYKISFLLKYYTGNLEKTSGNLQKLMRLRIYFWTEVLKALLEDKQVSKEILIPFLEQEDMLRSDEEKKRQQEIFSKTGKRNIS